MGIVTWILPFCSQKCTQIIVSTQNGFAKQEEDIKLILAGTANHDIF